MKFLPALTVRITHSYYVDGRCPDFHIAPTPDTARVLRNHRSVLKSFPDSVSVMIPVGEAGKPFIAYPTETKFAFYLRLQNEDLPLFTDLSALNGKSVPRYTNTVLHLGQGGELQLDSGSGMEIPSTAKRGVFAIVEIVSNVTAGLLSSQPPEFSVAFKAKPLRWRYYLITDEANAVFNIKDNRDKGTPLEFSGPISTTLSQSSDGSDDVIAQLASKYPGLRCLCFVSKDRIVCQENVRESIWLIMDGHTLSDPLPNPSLQRYAKVKAEQEEFVFHVIKYFSQPLSN